MSNLEYKKCNKCGETKNKNEFHKEKRSKDGYSGKCSKCTREYQQINKELYKEQRKEHYQKNKKVSAQYYHDNKEHYYKYRCDNKEEINFRYKQWYLNNKTKVREYAKKYKQDNKKAFDDYHKKYDLDNKETIKIYQKKYCLDNQKYLSIYKKQYKKENMESFRIYAQNRRSRKKSLTSTLTIQQWENIKHYFDNKCCYCGKELPLAQDHFVSVKNNGEYTLNNILPSCKHCNSSKGPKEFLVWYPGFKFYSTRRKNRILKFLNYKNNKQQLKII